MLPSKVFGAFSDEDVGCQRLQRIKVLLLLTLTKDIVFDHASVFASVDFALLRRAESRAIVSEFTASSSPLELELPPLVHISEELLALAPHLEAERPGSLDGVLQV